MKKVFLNKFFIMFLIACGITFIYFGVKTYINFHDGEFTPQTLGTMGDFVNPFITIVNLVIIGYLTFVLSNLEGERGKENLKTQKLIVLTQLRMDAVKKFDESLDEFYRSTNATTVFKAKESMMYIVNTIIYFQKFNTPLFKDLFTDEFGKDVYIVFINSSRALCTAFVKETHQFQTKEIQDLSAIYYQNKAEVIAILNQFIIEQMNKE